MESSFKPDRFSLMKELFELEKDQPLDFVLGIQLVEEDPFRWLCLLQGPPNSPYAGGTFILLMDFSRKHPVEGRPHLKFETKVYNPSVNLDSGRLGVPELGSSGRPGLSPKDCLQIAYGLLQSPRTDHPVMKDIAYQLEYEPEEFKRMAKQFTEQYARTANITHLTAADDEIIEIEDDEASHDDAEYSDDETAIETTSTFYTTKVAIATTILRNFIAQMMRGLCYVLIAFSVWFTVRIAQMIRGSCYVFFVFSVWFTVRSAVCSYLEDEQPESLDVDKPPFACAAFLGQLVVSKFSGLVPLQQTKDWVSWGLTALAPNQHMKDYATSLFALAPIQPMKDYATNLFAVIIIYWTRFWAVETYRLGMHVHVGDTRWQRLRGFLGQMAACSIDEKQDFTTYLLLVHLSAMALAVVFLPSCLDARLRGNQLLADYYFAGQESLLYGKLEVGFVEFWRLFLMHFQCSSLVASCVFHTGPLFGLAPGINRFLCFVCASVLLTMGIHTCNVVLA